MKALLRAALAMHVLTLGATVATLAIAQPAVDPVMQDRMTNVPKLRPWPIGWFQPQETVNGGPIVEWPRSAPNDAAFTRQATDAVVAYAEATKSDALIVLRDGRVEIERYWNGHEGATLTNTYYFHAALLPMLYGMAISEGKLRSLDMPAAEFLPEWRNDARRDVKLRDLLQMQSGLEMYFDSKEPASRAARLFYGTDRAAAALEFPAAKKPAAEFEYNYLVPEVLGLILERATGMRYSQYLSSRLWAPLGNRNASIWVDKPGGRPLQNAALFASARDWANVGQLLLGRGSYMGRRLFDERWMAEMLKPSVTNPNFGMLWLGAPYVPVRQYASTVNYKVNASEPYAAPDLFYIDGYGGQRIYIVPSAKLVIVRIGLSARDWDDAKLPNLLLRGVRTLAGPGEMRP